MMRNTDTMAEFLAETGILKNVGNDNTQLPYRGTCKVCDCVQDSNDPDVPCINCGDHAVEYVLNQKPPDK